MESKPALIELLSRLGNATALPIKCVVALHYLEEEGIELPTTREVRGALEQARVPRAAKMNLSDALHRAGSLVDARTRKDGRRGWVLTQEGRRFVSEQTGLPMPEELQEDVSTLLEILESVKDPQVRSYLEEAVDCLRVGAQRAFILMAWQAALHLVREAICLRALSDVNRELQSLDPKARQVKRSADFDYAKESTVLLLAQRLGILDKGQKDELGKALDLRNRCGHPGEYRVGPKKVSAFLEDLVAIVFSRTL